MSGEKGNNYTLYIGGDAGGKIAVGSHIVQVEGGRPAEAVTTSGELAEAAAKNAAEAVTADLVRVDRFLKEHFDVEELRQLAFDLGLNYEELGGAGKGAQVRELVLYFQRRRRLGELVAAAKERRPQAPW